MDPTTPDPWTELRARTPARLALGRAGNSMPTAELLRFGVAHAQARDAVLLPLDADALAGDFARSGWTTLQADSAAADRPTYLLRPDLGRRLSADSADALQRTASTLPAPIDLLLVVGDGLSSLAVARHACRLADAIRARIPTGEAWRLGPVVIVRQARVAVADEVGERLGAGLVAILIGERPGLSSPDSLGLYLTWAPRAGRSDAECNCISNIRDEGQSPEQAAVRFWWLAREARRLRLTGVGLKDRSDEAALVDDRPSQAPALSTATAEPTDVPRSEPPRDG